MYVGRAKFAGVLLLYIVKVHLKPFPTDSCPKEITPTSIETIGMYIYIDMEMLKVILLPV